MPDRVSDETLRKWTRTLTPGQRDLCRELLTARDVVEAARKVDAWPCPSGRPGCYTIDAEAFKRLGLAIKRYDMAREPGSE